MSRRDALLVALLSAAAAVFLAPALARPGWTVANFGDLYGYHIPLQHLAVSRLEAGQLPFWNPYIFAGIPHLADPQTVLFYPPALVLRVFPLAWAFAALTLFHVVLSLTGAHLLARRLGVGPAGAAALAASFAFSPFVAGRALQGVPTLHAALAWVPWTWLALLERRSWLLAGAWALQGLSGHPQFAAINALALAAWSLGDPRGRGAAFLRAAAAAAALACVQAVPSAELLSRSSRTGLPAAFASAYSMPPRALATVLVPKAFGDPRRGTFDGDPSEWFEEFTLSLGPAVPAFAALGAARVPGARAAAALAAAGALVAAGDRSPLWPLLSSLPGASLSRVPARFALWTLWGLWMAAALCWAAVAARGGAHGRRLRAWAAVLGAAAALASGAGLLSGEDSAPYLGASRAVAEGLGGRLERVVTAPELPNADKAMMYRMMNVNGYAAYFPTALAEFAARLEGRASADPGRLYLPGPASPAARALGAAAAVPGAGGAPFSRTAGALSLARRGPAAAELSSPRPERWSARAGGDGDLVVLVPADPGWSAWVDGAPAAVAGSDGLLISLPAGPGARSFELRYAPRLWALWCFVSAAAWAAWAAAGRGALAR